MSNAGTPRKPSLNKELDVAKKVTVYQNGNKHFAGCDAYLNQKYFPSPNIFMDHLTNLIVKKGGRQDKGCVRKLYTKSGKRIHGLAQINDGGEIVAAGNEDFQKYSYQSISPYKTPRKGQRQSRNNNFVPGRNNRYSDVKSRFNDTGEPSIRIYVHKNAQPLDKSLLVVLQQKRLDHMHYIMEDITREFFHDSKYPVDYICNLNGDMITKATDFVPEEFYVAVPPHQMFKQCDYSCRRYDPPNFIINPYYGTGLTRIPYLWQDPHSKHNPIPPISKPSPNQSVASHPEANLRRRKIRAQEDVHQKAVKHKRTPEKSVRQFEFDQDSSKIFRAKNQNKATKGAKEVKETKDTKTDLPLDQVKAEEVEEELFPPAHHHLAPLEINRRPSDEDHGYTKEDINGYDQDERRSPRGHPYTKEKSNRELNPYKVLDPIKKDQRSSTPVDDDRDDNDRHDDGKRRKEEEEAATKIQASFRGHQTRQQLAQQKTEDTSQTKQTNQTNKTKQTNQREDTQDSLTRQAENEAAAKIQAGFRGYQTRQELKAKGHK